MDVELLDEKRESDYAEVFSSSSNHLVYHSLKYRSFLKSVLSDCEDKYLIAYEDGRPVGALPAFVKRNAEFGPVVNSLPFFGSNGGVMVHSKVSNPVEVKTGLLDAFRDLTDQEDAAASTIISNPLQPDDEIYEALTHYTFTDDRIGQLVELRNFNSRGNQDLSEQLMAYFHRKTRNHIRKAVKSNVEVGVKNDPEAFSLLEDLHVNSMEGIGGRAKTSAFFEAIQNNLRPNHDFMLYVAWFENRIIAALLVLFSNKTSEYFMPATDVNYRSLQPMSLLIKTAMEEAVRREMYYWNWGGTWLTQDGVYDFKSRWGTEDYPYHYYIRVRKPEILENSKETLLNAYPNFYVCPFQQLKR